MEDPEELTKKTKYSDETEVKSGQIMSRICAINRAEILFHWLWLFITFN